MISLTDIAYSYPGARSPLFNGISLRVDAGSWVAVAGPDGAGKTTLAKLLKDLIQPIAGTISGDSAIPERVAYLGGDPYDMIVGLSVEDDIVFGMENQAVAAEEIESRLQDALRWTGLESVRYRLSHTLSGGEQQKLVLAGALAMRVQTLVLDEALSMLHEPARTSIRLLIQQLRHQLGMTIVEMTNRPDDLLHAERIIVLDQGDISFDGTAREFISTRWARDWCTWGGGVGALVASLIGSGVIEDPPPSFGDLASYLAKHLLEV